MKSIRILTYLLIMFSCCAPLDYTEELSGDYIFHDEGGADAWVFKNNNGMSDKLKIPRCIIAYDYDKSHILVSQVDIVPKDRLADEKSQLMDPKIINYWIIEVKEDKIYGPMNKSKYRLTSDSLNVSDKLQIN